LSGGQKSKVALGGILLKGVDVLLLDEPTNNLDLSALIWLENFLLKSEATCLIVSHDRRFLDNIISKVFEIEWFSRKLKIYSGGYSDYLELKEQEIRRQKELHRLQQEKIKRLEESARVQREWASRGARQTVSDKDKMIRGARRDRATKSAARSKAIERRLGQMKKVKKPRERPPLIVSLQAQENKAKQFIRLENVTGGYNSNFHIGPINLDISYGSRIGILGANGSGKSTLLKLITRELQPERGRIVIGSSLVIGNLMQEHENLPREYTLFQFFRERTKLDKTEIYRLLDHFHFEADEVDKKISQLSPGGRARLLLAFFSAISANVLVLDEPTNHLDLEAIEALEEVLVNYAGTVLLVSHDRYLLEQAQLTHVFLLSEGILKTVQSYDVYLASVMTVAKRLLKQL
jgi:ATPase subunit of ABC transporter with duplicated ATPase domains